MIFNNLGVNQGGVASGIFVRKYMADLDSYLSIAHEICINDEIIAHLLWADDLILFSDAFHGLQIQLNGLKPFCSNNHMIANDIKTKVIIFGNPKTSKLQFNLVEIDEVVDYKYLGNIISSIRLPKQNSLKKRARFCVTKQGKPHSAWQAKSNIMESNQYMSCLTYLMSG